MNRDERQRAVLKWVGETFGEESLAPMERVLRVLEEAVELAQAEGMAREQALAVVEYIFNKPPGEPVQEVGGLSVTLIAYCESRGILADTEEQNEFNRVLSVDPEHFRARHNLKADAGIAVRVEAGPATEWVTCECGWTYIKGQQCSNAAHSGNVERSRQGFSSCVPSWSNSSVLHLKTQRGQSYGSERKCCERCGVSLLPPDPLPWTEDERIYDDPPGGFVNCSNAKKEGAVP